MKDFEDETRVEAVDLEDDGMTYDKEPEINSDR